jgi:hypothetical protein
LRRSAPPPFDLVDIGLTTAAEANSLHHLETAAVQ